ncbi:MAG: PKD domain-containing protein, partial [Chitinophagia bacterium]|nr:PKD domain-containing protein [Chitinophagia bacterium]
YCPVDPITLTIDTVGMNLTKPVRFSFNNGVSYGLSNTYTFKGTKDTTLKVTFQDGNFCFANSVISVPVRILRLTNPSTSINVNVVDSACNDSRITVQYVRSNGSDILDYVWTHNGSGSFVDANGNRVTDPILNPITYIPAGGEVGKVTFTATNACFGITAKDSIKLIAVPVASIEIDPSQISNGVVQTVTPIRFTRTNAQPGEKYTFTFSSGASIKDTSASTITRYFTEGGNYSVTLSVKNASGCIDTVVLRFKVQETFNVFVPNIFSPSANTPADQNFRINGVGVSDGIELIVFDKWGKEVYVNKSFSSARDYGWNGKKKNVGDDQQSGTYTYVLRGKYVNGQSFEKTGSVTLIR